MFGGIKLKWRKAKALSVLQNAYEIPLKEPLSGLDDIDLRGVTATTHDTGGNEFDAAASFMTLRIKSAYEANLRLGYRVSSDEDDTGRLAVGLTRTRSQMKFYRLHMDAVSEIAALKRRVEERDQGNSLSSQSASRN